MDRRAIVEAIFVGPVRTLPLGGVRVAQSAIAKQRIDARVMVNAAGVEGDSQADRRVHGGHAKAVYFYPAEHRAFWRDALGRSDLLPNLVGENIASIGLTEDDVHVGDLWHVGSTLLRVTGAREPCYKLAAYLGNPRALALMVRSGRTGFYAAVEHGGSIGPGDSLTLVGRDSGSPTIAQVNDAMYWRAREREA